MDCEEKNIEDRDIVKDTNIKALHNLFEVDDDDDDDDDDHKYISIDGRKETNCDVYYYATILKLEPHKFSWVQVGNMSHARTAHGASVVNMKDIEKFCT